MRSREETGRASRTAGSNRALFTASSAERSRDSWPDEVRTIADTTLPVSSMNARIVTTPCHPAFFALRGYAGSISPRGRGARVVDPAAPGVASPGAPVPPPCPPKLATATAETPEADAAAGLSVPADAPAPPAAAGLSETPSGGCEPGAALSLAAEATPCGSAAAGAGGEAAPILGGETGLTSNPWPGGESSVTSMACGPGSLCPAIRGTKSMIACRLRAARTESANAFRGFTRAPPIALSYSFRLTPVTRENGGMG